MADECEVCGEELSKYNEKFCHDCGGFLGRGIGFNGAASRESGTIQRG